MKFIVLHRTSLRVKCVILALFTLICVCFLLSRTLPIQFSYVWALFNHVKPPNQLVAPTYLQPFFDSNEKLLSDPSKTPRQIVSNLTGLANKLSRRQRKLAEELLIELNTQFTARNIGFFMDGGTLLGSYRHHNRIPWDDDIDISADADKRELIRGIWPRTQSKSEPSKSSKNKSKFVMYTRDSIDKLYHVAGSFSSQYGWRFPYIDIFYYRQNRTHYHRLLGPDGQQYVAPNHMVFPGHLRPLGHMWMMAPRDSLQILFRLFGQDEKCRCMFSGYSHMIEDGMHSDNKPCKDLADQVPFVSRLPLSRHDRVGVKELLIFKNRVIQTLIVDEPSYAINSPFCINLIK